MSTTCHQTQLELKIKVLPLVASLDYFRTVFAGILSVHNGIPAE